MHKKAVGKASKWAGMIIKPYKPRGISIVKGQLANETFTIATRTTAKRRTYADRALKMWTVQHKSGRLVTSSIS